MQAHYPYFKPATLYSAIRQALVQQAGINGPRAKHYQFCKYYGLSNIG